MAAVLGAGFWLLHPLFVSTTLYIVQREAMLPATFTLLGLLSWLRGRTAILRGHTLSGLIWIAIGLGVCTVLAVLSKANGIVLPALALVLDYTVLQCRHVAASTALPVGEALAPTGEVQNNETSEPDREHGVGAKAPPTADEKTHRKSFNQIEAPHRWSAYRWTMWVMAWPAAAAMMAYLLYKLWAGMIHGVGRPWTLGQRLLTEPRVLMDYLGLLWLPRPFTPGLFNDHVQVSTSLLSPATTLPAILAVLGLIVGACLLRKRWPAAALAVLFYFVGQSLESSTIALELYFEHRNYLPAMLMFWPLALWLCGVRQTGISTRIPSATNESTHGAKTRDVAGTPAVSPDIWAKAKALLAVVLVLGLATMTWARADLWGNTRDQALLWAQLNPDSPRAQANAAQAEMRAGHPERAVARLQPALEAAPDEVQLALNLFAAQCQMGHVDTNTIDASEASLRTTRDPGTLLMSWFERAISQSPQPACPQANLDTLRRLLDAAEYNPALMKSSGRRQDIDYLLGRIALARHDADKALSYFNRALDQQVRIGAALKQAALLGSAGFPRQGLAHLDHYEGESHTAYKPGFGMPRIHAWVLNRQQYWPKELARLRATLRDDARQQASANE
jgi:tetratricopeptide (TPR) repeat protein